MFDTKMVLARVSTMRLLQRLFNVAAKLTEITTKRRRQMHLCRSLCANFDLTLEKRAREREGERESERERERESYRGYERQEEEEEEGSGSAH